MKIKSNLSRNFWIGLSCLIAIAMIYFGLNFLKGKNIFKKQNTYVAIFENVGGLNISSPIFVNGYQIGIVKSISIYTQNPISFAVVFDLEGSYRIPKGSTMDYGADFLGASTANLIISNNMTEFHEPGDTIRGIQKDGMLQDVERLMPKVESVLIQLDSGVLALNKILSDPMWEQSLKGVGSMVNEFNQTGKKANQAMGAINNDLPAITQNLSSVSKELKEFTNELNAMDIQKTYASMDELIENLKTLSNKLNETNNTAGLLTNSTELHDSLTNTLNTATKLLEDIRQNPQKYLSVKVRLF